MARKERQQGFTFVELLLVLTVTMLLCTLSVVVGNRQWNKQVEQQFLYQMQLDIESLQALAIERKANTHLYFIQHESAYQGYVYENGKQQIQFVRTLPTGVVFSNSSSLNHVSFTTLGTVSAFGTLCFNTPNGRKELIVNIGKGRMKYEE